MFQKWNQTAFLYNKLSLPFLTQNRFGNMHLQISLLLLFCLNIVHGGDGYFSERYQKQSSIKGPHFLPYNVKSQGKFTIFS